MLEKLLKPRPKVFAYGRVVALNAADHTVQVRLTSGLTLWADAGDPSPGMDTAVVIAGQPGDAARFVVQSAGGWLPADSTIIVL